MFDRLRESEFLRIEDLMKEARMLQKNEVTPEDAELIRRKIERECKNQKTIDFLYDLAQDDKFFSPGLSPALIEQIRKSQNNPIR